MGNLSSIAAEDARTDEALFWAAAHSDEEELVVMIGRAGNVNHKMKEMDGATPSIVAATEGALECLKLLLATSGCEVNRADDFGLTPLHYAARGGHADCVQALLAVGADPRRTARDGVTPAHMAVESDSVACLLLLRGAGASMDARQCEGVDVLHAARDAGATECERLLLADRGMREHEQQPWDQSSAETAPLV